MNRTFLSGRLTKDPDIRETTNGTKVARYTLAVERFKEGADFINCIAFDKRAEFVEKYLTKGMKILVEGHIQTGSYTDKNGNKVYTTDIVVESQEFAGAKKETEGQNVSPKEEKPTQSDVKLSGEWMNIPDGVADEGLPFV